MPATEQHGVSLRMEEGCRAIQGTLHLMLLILLLRSTSLSATLARL